MNLRERLRRTAIWATVALYFVVTIAGCLAYPDAWWSAIAWCSYPIVGAVILTTHPGHGVGRLLIAIALPWALVIFTAYPSLTASLSPWIEPFGDVLLAVAPLLTPLLVLVYPSGRLATLAGRILAVLTVAGIAILGVLTLVAPATLVISGRANPYSVPALAELAPSISDWGSSVPVAALLPAALIELAVRWGRARGAERLQFAWLALGAAVTALIIAGTLPLTGTQTTPVTAILAWVFAFACNAIPLCIGVAVTRHGLYEIGRVVSRTVAYALVSVGAIGVYVLVVTSGTWLLPDAPSVAVALATLVAAALFLPALRWLQRRLDRRFDRERYSAQRVVDDFGTRLRSQVDPEAANRALASAAVRTLQPAAVGLWMNGDPR